MKAASSGLVLTNHTLRSVRPCVVRDLAEAHSMSVEDWVDMHLGVPLTRFRQWSDQIGKARLFYDEDVQKALRGYCETSVEAERYDPLVNLLNAMISAGRKTTAVSSSDGKQYPINDLTFVDNHSKPIQPIPEHESVGAQRRPDIILMRGAAKPRGSRRAQWTDLLSWVEVKAVGDLQGKLGDTRITRGLPRKLVLKGEADTENVAKPPAGTVAKVCPKPVHENSP